MFATLRKPIYTGLAILMGSVAFGSEPSTAKGGSLGARTNDGRKHFTLSADAVWRLNVTERFDASALVFYQGKLLTINDRDGVIYELELGTNGVAKLKRTDLFPKRELQKASPNRASRFDGEGLAVDANGNLYLSEESHRLVFRSSPGGKVEALAIDWSSVQKYFSGGVNASFEGIAVAPDRIFVANERSSARIIVVDLSSLEVTDSFFVDSSGFAFGGPHYSDLAFAENRLFILNRNHRCIFEVEPDSKRVIAEHSFGKMELDEEVAYFSDFPTGAMEGLAVDKEYFWMVTDNNGKGRVKDPRDFRPTLFRCKRPMGN